MDADAARRMMRYDANKRRALFAVGRGRSAGRAPFLPGQHRNRGADANDHLLSLPWALVFWGRAGLFLTIIWVLIDALRLPGMVQHANNTLIASLP